MLSTFRSHLTPIDFEYEKAQQHLETTSLESRRARAKIIAIMADDRDVLSEDDIVEIKMQLNNFLAVQERLLRAQHEERSCFKKMDSWRVR